MVRWSRSMLTSIAFAPDDFLAAVFGKGHVRLSRLSAMINLVFPFKTLGLPVVSSYVSFDVVVTDHNPFLAALALRRALNAGKTVLLVCGDHSDHWPYDLLLSRPLSELLAGLSKQEAGFEDDPIPVAMRLITAMVRPFSDRIVVSSSFKQVHVSNRHPEGQLVLYGDPHLNADEPKSESTDRKGLLASLRNAVKSSLRLKNPAWGRVAIFTKALVITGRADGVAHFKHDGGRILWSHPLIQPMGSAAFMNDNDPISAKNLISELFEIFSTEF